VPVTADFEFLTSKAAFHGSEFENFTTLVCWPDFRRDYGSVFTAHSGTKRFFDTYPSGMAIPLDAHIEDERRMKRRGSLCDSRSVTSR